MEPKTVGEGSSLLAKCVSVLKHLLPLALGSFVGYASFSVWQTVFAADAVPSLSLVQPPNGSVVSGTIGLQAAASDAGLVGVRFAVNGTFIGSEITSGSCTQSWNTTKSDDGSYALAAIGRTKSGWLTASDPVIVTVSNLPPNIFDITAWDLTSSSASITWYTNQETDSRVEFGPNANYGSTTLLDPNGLTIHTQVLTGLSPGTTYHFRVLSRNVVGRTGSSADQIFATPDPSGLQTAVVGNAPRILLASASASPSTAIITWTTDQPSDSRVAYGLTIVFAKQSPLDSALTTEHRVTLTGLSSGKVYQYRVQSRDARGRTTTSDTLKFTTTK